MPNRYDDARRQLAFSALEIVQNQLILRINERNEQLRQLTHDQTHHKAILEYSGLDLLVDEGDVDLMHEPRITSADGIELRGTRALLSMLGKSNNFIKRVYLLELENSFMIERVQMQNIRSQVAILEEKANRRIDILEEDPSVGNMKLSALTEISERLFKASAMEEQKHYMLKWNDAMRQVIHDVDQVESDLYQWEHFDKRAKRFELQVKLYSFQTLSVASQTAMICFPLVELENRCLAESALRRIFNLKVKWLEKHIIRED